MLEASDNGGRVQPFPLRRFRQDAMACTFELVLVCEDAAYAEQAARAKSQFLANMSHDPLCSDE